LQTPLLDSLLEARGGERRINYALDRFRAALKHIGNPERDVYTVVISGTNGKGSTALLVSSALVCAGFRVGTYLSPHLQSPVERFLLNLNPIEESELTELALEFEKVAEQFELSYFEFLTLLNFVWVKRKAVDFCVLEVGLGGRLDATNVTDPLACAVTNIDFDHEEYLGKTLEAILDEKLGIIPPEGLLFTGIAQEKLRRLIEKKCEVLDAIYYYAGELRTLTKRREWAGQDISINGFPFQLSNPSVGTAENATLAFLLLRIVFPKIEVETIQHAFEMVGTPGRMEVVQDNPRVVLSGDHNPGGLRCLLSTLEQLRAESLRTLCAFSPDKPYKEMFKSLQSISTQIELTEISKHKNKFSKDYYQMGNFIPNPLQAVEQAVKKLSPQDTLLITGSLYLVGEVRKLWHSKTRFWKGSPATGKPSFAKQGASSPAKPRTREATQSLSHARAGEAP